MLLLDWAGWRTTGNLVWPRNITPILLPSRLPELNPVEQVWQYLRANYLSNRVFDNYDAIVDADCDAWSTRLAQPQQITSIGMRTCLLSSRTKLITLRKSTALNRPERER